MSQAFIADELKTRLLEHAPHCILPAKRLDLSRANIQKKYQDAEFDCVIAPLVLISQEDMPTFFKEIHRILAPNGIFLFSTLGTEAPHELEILGDTLLKTGFQLPVVDREVLKLHYENMSNLLRDLELSDLDEKHMRVTTDSSEDIMAIFDVMYGYAVGASAKTLLSEKIEIPIESIKIRKPL